MKEIFKKMRKKLHISPQAMILISFCMIILISGTILSLPVSTVNGKGIRWIDGIFTATSAVCVTGLSVNDMNSVFNLFGKTLILILIQLGGLGLITISSLFIILLSRKINYYTKKAVEEDLNTDKIFNIQKYVKNVIFTVFLIEFSGAVFLLFEFSKIFELKRAAYYSVFHSISAFCNAGFSLFSNNLSDFKSSFILNLVISLLIILGGIGFSTLLNIYRYFSKKDKKLTITSKLSINISLILILIGTISIFIIEYSNEKTIGNLSFLQKITASIFQSVSVRTAGFNTISLVDLKDASTFLFIILMFIGASPGSTGGGIKTTTIGIIFLGIRAILFNKENLEFSRRRIEWNNFNKAIVLFFISIIYIAIILFLMMITEKNIEFIDLLFEIVSAFGTVGLSKGVTSLLSDISKSFIIFTMFIGRVGPLTVTLVLLPKKIKSANYKYPAENIIIG